MPATYPAIDVLKALTTNDVGSTRKVA